MRRAPVTKTISAAQSKDGPEKFTGIGLWEGKELNLLGGQVMAVKVGGHFPGSSVLLWKETKKLLVADSVMVVPSGVYHVDRLPGTTSFTFMWSYPNFVSFLFLFVLCYSLKISPYRLWEWNPASFYSPSPSL